MSTAVVCTNCSNLNAYTGSRAYSDDSKTIRDEIRKTVKHLRAAFSIGRSLELALENLNEIYLEALHENWDGYGAAAVSSEAKFEVERFLDLLPSAISFPEIAADPDGDIGLVWSNKRANTFTISFSGRNKINYSGLYGVSEVFGVEVFVDVIPQTIIANLRRLYNI